MRLRLGLPGGVRTSQAVSHALAFFWLDGFAVPALVVEWRSRAETQRRQRKPLVLSKKSFNKNLPRESGREWSFFRHPHIA